MGMNGADARDCRRRSRKFALLAYPTFTRSSEFTWTLTPS